MYILKQPILKEGKQKKFTIILILTTVFLMIITLPITAKEVNNEASMNVQSNSVMQGIAITGTVTDRDGQPLPGASIEIKGASQ